MIQRFGVFELDGTTGELRRSGVRIRVQDQPLRILRELIARRGEIVTREELRTKIWGDTFVDYDRALNTAIKKLRDALGDSADAPRYVETVARKGYRFVAPVEDVTRAEPAAEPVIAAAPEPPAPAAPPRWRKPAIVIAIIVTVVIALSAILLRRGDPEISAIAVLPFANLTGSPANDYVADGVTDALISDLANLPALRVISRTSAMQYKNARKPLPRIAAELAVDGIVEGSVLRFGDRVRVEVKLIDGKRDALLWSDQYERNAGELDALQRDVASAIAVQLRSRGAIVAPARPTDAEAHLLTMKAKYWSAEKRNGIVARQLLRQAIDKDPTHAPAYAALAEAEIFGPEETTSPLESLLRAKVAVEKAIALDPNLGEAHAAHGLVLMFLDHDFAAAERAFRRSLELKPGAAETHHRYGQLLVAMGRFEEALAEAKRATELDPFSTLALNDYGRTLYFARRYDEALVQYDRALAIETHDQIATWFRAWTLIAAKRYEPALEEIRGLMKQGGYSDAQVAEVLALYRTEGYPAVSKNWADLDAEKFAQRPFVRSSGIAARYAQAGEADLAFEWLERAKKSHTRDLVYVNVEPQYDRIRNDPRFARYVISSSARSAPASPRP